MQTKAPATYRFGCEIDPSGALSIVEPDRALIARVGIPAREIAQPGGWMRAFPPEDLADALQAVDRLAKGQEWSGRVRIRPATGETFVLEMEATPGPLEDGRRHVSIRAWDCTQTALLERALAEARGRLALLDKGLPLGMWSTDRDLNFTWSSGTIFGEENLLAGTALYEYFETNDPEAPAIAAHLTALGGETATYDVEWEGLDLRCLLDPMFDEIGRIAGVIAVAVDLNALMQIARTSLTTSRERAVHDRIHPSPGIEMTGERISIAGLVIDRERFSVQNNGAAIPLSVTEFNLLFELAKNPGAVLSRKTLGERVWGHPWHGESTALTMAISRLRDKIEDDPRNPKIIETVRGVGYRMVDEDDG